MSHFEQYYAEPGQIVDGQIVLGDEEFNHAIRVRRKQLGDRLVVTDGQGNRYSGPIVDVQKRQLTVRIEETVRGVNEPAVHLTLAQAWPKGQHMDWVVEKGTELGVSRFVPVLCERSIIDPGHRLPRLQKKAVAAMKQCGRSRLPIIDPPQRFVDWIAGVEGPAFIAHDVEVAEPLAEAMQQVRQIGRAVLLVWPEGGLSDEEFSLAVQAGWIALRLGERRLRSETAALVGVVKLLTLVDEL